ncbi:hypothetical protein GUJ93_ZPchr0006g41315 [Zizania palustris]|uniref:RRM domain-containing protein n=1 Tax=Zizania palustris TaxID=103762 RepID=A0A8J5VV96_ZIZPA|nr:hypothetical protein GUJ93_ZPchr0006g41315 [Zizania palustris]
MAASSSTSSAAGGGSPAAHALAGGGGGVTDHRSKFGDTTLTKVFVGGLAWETPSKGLQEHFQQYGEILEAVVICDRETGRSKGYGFVTFRDPESAREAVRIPNPTIGGRRANCNIASMGPPRPSPSRGRAPRGSHFPDQLHMGPPPYSVGGRMPSQQTMNPAHPTYHQYHPQFGYWYPPDYPYQQAMYNSQMIQHYYSQLYGPTSPSTPSYQYMGYMPGGPGPRTGFSLMQQAARPPFVQQPATQFEGSFPPGPSLPPNFRLQLPPHAMSRQSDDTSGSQPAPPVSASAATTTDTQEESKPVGSNSDLNNSN